MIGNDTLTAVGNLMVGHADHAGASTGCTVILPRGGAIAGVDVRGGAPGTYGTDSLQPINLVDRIHGLFFTGGSAFGLSVADGVRRFLKERAIGFDSAYGPIPIVAGAVIFDLGMNAGGPHPDADLGRQACENASDGPVAEGCVGAGAGATVGKLHGLDRGMKSGLGCALIEAPTGVKVGALMVVNAFGDVVDPLSGRPIAGCRDSAEGSHLVGTDAEIRRFKRLRGFSTGENTVVGVVATNVAFTKTELTKVAQMAQDGLARTVSPSHTLYDGDAVFALSCGELTGVEVTVVGSLAAQAAAEAILRGVRRAEGRGAIPSVRDLFPEDGIRDRH